MDRDYSELLRLKIPLCVAQVSSIGAASVMAVLLIGATASYFVAGAWEWLGTHDSLIKSIATAGGAMAFLAWGGSIAVVLLDSRITRRQRRALLGHLWMRNMVGAIDLSCRMLLRSKRLGDASDVPQLADSYGREYRGKRSREVIN